MPADLPDVVKSTLVGLHEAVREDFTRNRRVMSFAEYLALVFAEPTRQLRSSTQYIVDAAAIAAAMLVRPLTTGRLRPRRSTPESADASAVATRPGADRILAADKPDRS